MKKALCFSIELVMYPLLALLLGVSIVGRAAHNTGRFVADTLDELEQWSA